MTLQTFICQISSLKQFFVRLKQQDINQTPPFDNFLHDSLQNGTTRNASFSNRRFALAAILILSILGSLFIVNNEKSSAEKALSRWRSPTKALLRSPTELQPRTLERPEVFISNWSSPTASLANINKVEEIINLPSYKKSRKNNNHFNL